MWRDKILTLMERLDPTYALLKKNSKGAASAEERIEASELPADREMFLQPTYKQIALLYADLHE
jgi:acetyl-CoA carboxylase/biotin carboxylase 1